MASADKYSIVITTTDSDELTQAIASALLEARLAACIQTSSIRSFYRWDGAVQDDKENLLLIKCKTADFPAIEAAISRVHTYDEPEIVQVSMSGGSAGYLNWIDSETSL